MASALNRAKEATKAADLISAVRKVDGLSRAETATIALQAKHDILADDDANWEDTSRLLPTASIIARVLADAGAANANDADLPDRARKIAGAIERRRVQDALKRRELGLLDEDFEAVRIPSAPTDRSKQPSSETIKLPGELTRRLAENGLAIPAALTIPADSPPGMTAWREKVSQPSAWRRRCDSRYERGA